MESTYIPLNGKEFDVEITKVEGKKFGMRIIDKDGKELDVKADREIFVQIAEIIRRHHPEVIAQAKMFFSGRMTEEQKMAMEIEALMNG